jgi:two-component system, NarL family, nitrate/nitrite response regulator NarL
MQSGALRIALVHRDGLYRDCLCRCLAQAESISVVHCASGLDHETWEVFCSCGPDLLLLEYGLCRRHGFRQSAKGGCAASPAMKVIVVGVPNREEDILACIESEGAAGYLSVDSTLSDLMENINAVMNGETLCSPRIASLAFDRVSALTRWIENGHAGDKTRLTRREAEIVSLIDVGLSNKDIAARLHIEVSTVKNHVHNILDKLKQHDRQSVVRYVKEHGLSAPMR